MKAINALYEAQKIAFSPFVFQTAYTMMKLRILDAIFESKEGISISELETKTSVSKYGLTVLLEMAETYPVPAIIYHLLPAY